MYARGQRFFAVAPGGAPASWTVLSALALCALTGCFGSEASIGAAAREPFSVDEIKRAAEALADTPQVTPERVSEPFLRLDYDTYRMIAPRHDTALWRDEGLPFWVEFFSAGFIYPYPVKVSVVTDGSAEPVQYGERWFQFRGIVEPLGRARGGGFAGWRLLSQLPGEQHHTEFFVFQGASYYRAIGTGQRYGASARGLAIDIGLGQPEEFPRFRKFWIEKPATGAARFRAWALLDSPAVTGLYEFQIERGATTTADVDAQLYFRHGVMKVAIAPLTSMFMWDAASRPTGDPRPQVHDSDGLLIQDGDRWVWRKLQRPSVNHVASWPTDQLRGFGLVQRDRQYEHYLDDEAYYDKRPSLWVTPAENWGPGHVELLELTAEHEGVDNISAYWVPDEPVVAGSRLHLRYRMAFGQDPEQPKDLVRVVDTRTTALADGASLVAVSFGPAASGAASEDVLSGAQPVVHSESGQVDGVQLLATEGGGRMLVFRYRPAPEGRQSIDAYLTSGAETVSEVWSFR